MPSFSTSSRWRPTSADQQPGNDEDVEREEARQRLAGDDRPAQHHLDELAARRTARAPRSTQPMPSPQYASWSKRRTWPVKAMPSVRAAADADDPGQLARVLERAEEEHLHHVDEHQRDHEVGAPPVHRAQKPAERLLGVEDARGSVGLVGRRHVDERQADPGHDLQHEERERAAAEDVPPARRAARHAVRRRPRRMASPSCRRRSSQSPTSRIRRTAPLPV